MSEDVSWPKASEGGSVVGKEEIREYWIRQWKEFDPHVEPVEVIEREGGETDVRVHQLSEVVAWGGSFRDGRVAWHVYTIRNGVIERMDLRESDAGSEQGPSAAFAKG